MTEEEYEEKIKSIDTKHSELLKLITEFGNEVKKLEDIGEDVEDLAITMNGWLAVWKNKELQIDRINRKFNILNPNEEHKKLKEPENNCYEQKRDSLLDIYIEILKNKYQKYNDVDKQVAAEKISKKERYVLLEEAIEEYNKLIANSSYEYKIYMNVDSGRYMIVEDSLYDFMLNHGYKQFELVQWELIEKIGNSVDTCCANISNVVNLFFNTNVKKLYYEERLFDMNVKLDYETNIDNILREFRILKEKIQKIHNEIRDDLFKINKINSNSIEKPFDVNKIIDKIDKQIEELKEEELENEGDGQF